eukprot:49198_1
MLLGDVSVLVATSCCLVVFTVMWKYFTTRTEKRNVRSIHVLMLYCDYTSHGYWSRTYQKYSNHTVSTMSIKGSYFKWRMQASAISFAKTFIHTFIDATSTCDECSNNDIPNQIPIQCDLKTDECPHIIIIDDMIDLNLFSTIISSYIETHNIDMKHSIKYIYFMHENQLTIPWKSNDRDIDKSWMYGLQNFKCMLGAHQIWWNSNYHANAFFTHLPKVIKNKSSDDWTAITMISYAQQKSKSDMYIPMDLNRIDEICSNMKHKIIDKRRQIKEPIILWNARWEADKNPSLFLYALRHIKQIKAINAFKLVVLGENFSYSKGSKHSQNSQSVFDVIYEEFKDCILQFGYVESYREYILWLNVSDILIMTSAHEFFGISLMESMYCQTIPILPNNLVYVEHFECMNEPYPYFYNHKSKGDLVKTLIDILQKINGKQNHKLMDIKRTCKQVASKYSAGKICKVYDATINDLLVTCTGM